MAKPKTWNDKLSAKKQQKVVRLESDFAGIPAGQMLFVGTPQIIANYIKRIPHGQTRTIERMRRDLARRNKCDATCPVSTSIFIRIAAEAAIEDLDNGKSSDAVLPFWRLVEPDSKIAKRLAIDTQWIADQRDSER